MNQINWGILGCGDVTEVKSGPAFKKVPNSTTEAVMRRDAEKAKDYANRHQISKWYASAEELISDENINAIYIATPPAFHKDYAIEALKAGKNVYIEKPVTLTVAECEEIIATEKLYQKKVTVAHYRRALPLFIKIKELIDEQAIGDIRIIDLKLYQKPGSTQIAQTAENWRINPALSGGGLFYDLAPHQLDILVHIFGTPNYINGFSKNQSQQNAVADITSGQLIFNKDIVFNGLWCFNSHPDNELEKCEMIGSKGKIVFSFFGHDLDLTINSETEHFSFKNTQHIQQNMIEKTVNYFLGKGENPCSLEDALLSLKIMENFGRDNTLVI
ncbi:Gfo/Idh/MocA family protein [Pedobacter cryophilus]|uniref:Gfo/Idh/MocA family oxidoreductase n=1 Tax=Pedobacter cryophilus TaxID=2571271 RepID=A0A4U1C642_9SPHI|nr:Gfo/Idh/MocA family oxidoreductase [Pedobacter cryophilus]TKB98820.1 Gfo/Idh/MocA family oxidoreductase [Pedobacter cryophilus]